MSVGRRCSSPRSAGALDPARFDQRLLVGAVGPEEGDYAALRAPDLDVESVTGLGREPHAGRDVRALYEISRVRAAFRPHIVHTHKAKAGVLGAPPCGPTGCLPPSTPSTVICSPGTSRRRRHERS